MTKRFLLILAGLVLTHAAQAAEPVPGDACSTAGIFQRSGGPEISGVGNFMVCQGGTWKSILSWDAAAAITKVGNLTCNTNEILKFNGTTWACAADATGSGLPSLTSADIWVGNGSNTATAVTMSGDATLSNAGALTIANDAVTSAKIADGTITAADTAVIGTLTEGKWCTVSSGKIVCTSNAPAGADGGFWKAYNEGEDIYPAYSGNTTAPDTCNSDRENAYTCTPTDSKICTDVVPTFNFYRLRTVTCIRREHYIKETPP